MPTLDKYLSRITSEHADKSNYVAFVTALLSPMIDAQRFYQGLITTFDLDNAIGAQLDAVGLWIGRSRQVRVPIAGVFFSLDTTGLGFDQGYWKGLFDSDTGITFLDDQSYRQLLKAKVIMNTWDGSIPVAAAALDELFGNNPNTLVAIEDDFDMTMTISVSGVVPGNVIIALLEGGYVPIKPEGVRVNYFITSVNTAAVFGFDTENDVISGFDVGAWAGSQVNTNIPGQVTGFAVAGSTPNAVTLSWVAPTSGVGPFTYQLQYQLGTGGSSTWVKSGAPTALTTGTVSGLAANTTYSFSVFPIALAGAGPLSAPLPFTTSSGIPGQVTGLHASGTAATTVSLAWNVVVGNGITYQVQFRVSGQPTFANFGVTVAGLTSTVTGLSTGVVYDFQVFARNQFGAGIPSTILTIGTSGAIPGVPQTLAVTTTGQNDVALSWSQPTSNNGPYTYQVQFAQNINPIVFTTFNGLVNILGTGGNCDVTGLIANQAYVFHVAASNTAGLGPFTANVSATTLPSAPPGPATLTSTGVSSSTVGLSWPAVTGAATYQVQVEFVASPGTFANFGSPVAGTTTTVTGLAAATAYNIQVRSVNSGGIMGLPSPLVSVTTTGVVVGSATALTPGTISNTSVALTWTPSGTGTTPFVHQVQYKLSSQSVYNNFGQPVPTAAATVTNLQPGQSYDFQVISINSFGTAAASSPITASTTGTTVTVTWNPSDKNADIVLSNSNLTAVTTTPPITAVVQGPIGSNLVALTWTAPNPAGFYGVRATNAQTTGKFYIEFNVNYLTTNFAVGIATSAWNFATQALGSNLTSVAFLPGSTGLIVKLNNVTLLTGALNVGQAGDTVSLAVDLTAKRLWVTTEAMRSQFGANAWNSSSTANPATGVNGIDISALTPGSWFPAFGDIESSGGATITPSAPFTIALPVGFTAWGGTGSLITPPGQPTSLLNGTATDRSVPLSWVAPVSGSAPGIYHVQYRKTGTTPFLNGPRVTQTTAVVTNLIPGTSYDFQVIARNLGGAGAASATLTVSTAFQTTPAITYHGLNIANSGLSAISALPAQYPHVNAVVIPVFVSTASQTSTDVTLTTAMTMVGGWIDAAITAGFQVFIGIYLIPRDGTPTSTLTPGPSFAGVSTFMANLQTIAVQAAQLGQQHGALGLFTGVELQPWAGLNAGDTGPWSALHAAEWQALYNACKAVWPAGLISYAALQTTLGLDNPNGSWSVQWPMWDAIVLDLYPGSDNSFTTTTQFTNFFNSSPDPDPSTVSAVGQTPLFARLATFSNSVGRPIIVNQAGIIPADGNQVLPGQRAVLPPPFDFAMQSAWWQAVLNQVSTRAPNFAGIFAWDGGANGFRSTFTGIDYFGIGGTVAASAVDTAFAALTGAVSTLPAPTGLHATTITNTTIAVAWNAVTGTGITYVVQFSVDGANTFTSLAATAATTATISGLQAATNYDIQIFARQNAINGPTSVPIVVLTTGTATRAIIVNPVTGATGGNAFSVNGTLTGYAAAPTLSYIDDEALAAVTGVTETQTSTAVTLNWGAVTDATILPFPVGATVTSTSFAFQHPGLPTGSHKLTIFDGTINTTITYTVT